MRSILKLAVAACVLLALTTQSRADEAADAKALLEKAIKAYGGEAKLSKIKATTMKSKGKYYGGGGDGVDYTEETFWMAPDKERNDIKFEADGKKNTFIMVFNGDKSWESLNGDTKERSKDAVAELKEGMHLHQCSLLYPLLDKAYTLTPISEVKVNDKAAVGIKVAHKDHRDLNILFDKNTNHILKIETQVKDLSDEKNPKEVTEELFFDDYKDVDGLPVAHKMNMKRANKKFVEAEVTEIKIVDKLDGKLFEKP
jgi:hypothetical protein